MSKEGSVAPKERVNITYKPATGNAKEEVELPLKLLMLGDYTQRPDPQTLEDRKPISVDKDNFSKVMSEQKLALNFAVKDQLSDETQGNELNVNLKFRRLSDMEPEAIANQVPELKKLLDLRAALTALKGPLGNEKAFRNKIQQILGDPAQRNKLINELGLKKEGE
jgi:type VI secretion system protein ImpB